MWNDNKIKLALSLAEQRGKFLYEVLPEFIQFGFLTELEMELWSMHLNWKQSLLDNK